MKSCDGKITESDEKAIYEREKIKVMSQPLFQFYDKGTKAGNFFFFISILCTVCNIITRAAVAVAYCCCFSPRDTHNSPFFEFLFL